MGEVRGARARRPRARAARHGVTILSRIWLIVVVLVAAWWFSERSESFAFPPLSDIATKFRTDWLSGDSLDYLQASVVNLVLGYGIAGILGIVIGAVLWCLPNGYSNKVTPLLYFVYVIPSVALLPAIMVVMGLGMGMKVAIIVIASVWPCIFNTFDGMRGTPPLMLDTAKTLHMSSSGILFRVVFRNALPQIMAGLRYSLQLAVIMMAVSEFVASTSGIGAYILDAQHHFDTTAMWTGVILLGLLGTFTSFLFVAVERRILFWQK